MATVFAILFVLICPLIIFIVLVQDPKGGGLAGVLGGAGGTSAFGAKTADVVMKVTIALGVVFFVLAIALGLKLKQTGTTTTSLQPEIPATAPAMMGEEGATEEEGEPAPAPEGVEGETPAPTGTTEEGGASPTEAAPQPAAGDDSGPAERAPAAAAETE